MTGFSIDWLNLREPADLRARAGSVLDEVREFLLNGTSQQPTLIVDLGCGTGSTLRALEKHWAGTAMPLRWCLIDNDPELLAEAERRCAGEHEINTLEQDLGQVQNLPVNDASLVTASALFDLVSADFVERLVEVLVSQKSQGSIGVYAALNYDGTTQWTPAHPLDDVVLAAFNRDQQRDKGFGPALGPAAHRFMERTFSRNGFIVTSAPSPWNLAAPDAEMQAELIRGMVDAVKGDASLTDEGLKQWSEFRNENLLTGNCCIGHQDIFARLPGN